MIGGIPHEGKGPGQFNSRRREVCQECGEYFKPWLIHPGNRILCGSCHGWWGLVKFWYRELIWRLFRR